MKQSDQALAITKHFVTFYSPGTIVSETTTKPIEAWDIEAAKEMARGIKERHGATPYAFQFSTRGRAADELDSRTIEESSLYYLGGAVETLAEVEARAPGSILASNMRINRWNRVITNNNSWKYSRPLQDTDIILEWP